MVDDIKIREISEGDIKKVISFHNLAFNDNRTDEDWNWEYRGIYPNRYIFVINEDNDQVVGTQAMIPIYLNINGKRQLSGKSENSLLDKKYRGKNLWKEMYDFAISKCKKKDFCCIWGYTSATKVMRDKLKFSVYEDAIHKTNLIVDFQKAFLDVIKGNQKFINKIAISILTLLRYMYGISVRSLFSPSTKKLNAKYSLEKSLKSINDCMDLYKRLRNKYPYLIHIDQSEEYLKWRIFNNPNIKYNTYFVYEGALLRGYCYISSHDKKIAHLTDFTFENSEAGSFLLQILLNEWQHKHITNVQFMGNAKNKLMLTTFSLLKKYGFLEGRSSMSFVLKNISYPNEEFLYDIKNWYVGGIWTEGYKI
jgi:L-amino acid N-acyltransferase YncA